MDLSEVTGYRMVLQAHYDDVFRALPPDAATRSRRALDGYVGRVLAALSLPEHGRHLDLGCGAGLAALAVAQARPDMEVTGLDASPAALQRAREAADALGLHRIDFVEGDAETPPPRKVQRASALSVFNLMPSKADALRAWRRTLSNGGRLVLTDAFTLAPTGSHGTGPMSEPAFVALARHAGFRPVHREDLTPLVKRLHAEGVWPWPEYVRPGFRYLLVALEAV